MFSNLELKGKYNQLPVDDDDDLMPGPKSSATPGSLSKVLVGSLVLAVLGSLILYASTSMVTRKETKEAFAKGDSVSINYSFKRVGYPALSYFDDTNDSFLKYKFLLSKAAVIEPYASMEFHMYTTSASQFNFTVCSDNLGCQSGQWVDGVSSTVKFDCSPYDEMSISVSEIDTSTDTVVNTQEDTALCLYVRREIRSLNEYDRSQFIKASKRIEYYDDATGQAMFGSDYVSLDSLLKYHHFNSGMRNADHIHEGNGFTIQHVKLTNMFEASVQAVDPSVVMPYWDYTIDSSTGVTIEQAFVFQDSIYGKGVRPADLTKGWRYSTDNITDARISSGLWKDTKASANPYGESWNYGYGYMRAPWSMNPSPYVSRFTMQFVDDEFYFPNCSNHFSVLQYDDMMDFYYEISYDAHGPIHQMNGGIYGCDLLDTLVESGYITDKNNACDYWGFMIKENYRAGYITPKKNCVAADNIQDSNCGYTCSGSVSEVFTTVSLLLEDDIDLTKDDIEQVFYDFICDGGDGGRLFPGDHLESASPSDPSFWVIHPTLERLLHAKLLAGGFSTSEWAVSTTDDYVCSKSTCYDQTTDSFITDDCCYGHYEYDQLYDGVAADLSVTGPTNHEIQEATDPRSETYSMNYIYDDFEWDHCYQNFNQLLSDMYLDSISTDGVRRVPRPKEQMMAIKQKARVVEFNKEKLNW